MRTNSLQPGSVIAVTVLFMSFLLVGLVGAAYLLSSQLRITSLGAEYLQATYNAESALELSLYSLKHRREGYETTTSLPLSEPGKSPASTLESKIQYRLTPETARFTLGGGAKKLALYYEEASGSLRNLSDMPGLHLLMTAKGTPDGMGNCLEVNLVGLTKGIPQGRTSREYESISAEMRCGTQADLTSLKDDNPRTYTVADSTKGYSFRQFLQEHTEVLLLINGKDPANTAEIIVQGVTPTETLASASKEVIATGKFGSVIIRKFVTLTQDQLPELFSRVLVQ